MLLDRILIYPDIFIFNYNFHILLFMILMLKGIYRRFGWGNSSETTLNYIISMIPIVFRFIDQVMTDH